MPIAASELRERVSAVVDDMGTAKAAAHLGVSREALARVVAQLDVRAGTIALLHAKLFPAPAVEAPKPRR